jgi:hypothetical protein
MYIYIYKEREREREKDKERKYEDVCSFNSDFDFRKTVKWRLRMSAYVEVPDHGKVIKPWSRGELKR